MLRSEEHTSELLWQGHFYSELHLAAAIPLIAAPTLAWIAEIPKLRGTKTWQRELVRFAVVLIPIAIALFLAYQYWASVQGQDEYYY